MNWVEKLFGCKWDISKTIIIRGKSFFPAPPKGTILLEKDAIKFYDGEEWIELEPKNNKMIKLKAKTPTLVALKWTGYNLEEMRHFLRNIDKYSELKVDVVKHYEDPFGSSSEYYEERRLVCWYDESTYRAWGQGCWLVMPMDETSPSNIKTYTEEELNKVYNVEE